MFVKFVSAVILCLEVLVFSLIPYFYSKAFSNKKLVGAFNNFSAGLFLGIAFLHVIPQANIQLTDWRLRNYPHHQIGNIKYFPYGSLVAIITFLIVLGLEVYMNDGITPADKNQGQKRNNSHMYQVLTNEKLKSRRRRLILETYLTQLALSIHSLFECMSIGVENKERIVLTLLGAIAMHKWAQALTLGFSYSISGMPKQTAIKFAIFHSLLNAGAILIGHQLSDASDIVKGITNGISGGTFIYITMIEKIGKNFLANEDIFPKLSLIFSGLFFSILILY